ncbi:MAG: metalloprotease ybeY [Firmicutes bacterium]|nr:metalloprotease ybeY [Bacillota bacterium]
MLITSQMEETVMAVLSKAAEVLTLSECSEVSVVFVDDEAIRELNRDYRGKDMATDVLSFALEEGEEPEIIGGPEEALLGDIIISLETANRQAQEYGHSPERELAYLAVHGMLHLVGYDHEQEDDKAKMRRQEEEILMALGINRGEE